MLMGTSVTACSRFCAVTVTSSNMFSWAKEILPARTKKVAIAVINMCLLVM
jgi:hypothetical protein